MLIYVSNLTCFHSRLSCLSILLAKKKNQCILLPFLYDIQLFTEIKNNVQYEIFINIDKKKGIKNILQFLAIMFEGGCGRKRKISE